jgi:hypothetical protein
MHYVIIHHVDGECSTEGRYDTKHEAIVAAERIAKSLHNREYAFTCGYIMPGQRNKA